MGILGKENLIKEIIDLLMEKGGSPKNPEGEDKTIHVTFSEENLRRLFNIIDASNLDLIRQVIVKEKDLNFRKVNYRLVNLGFYDFKPFIEEEDGLPVLYCSYSRKVALVNGKFTSYGLGKAIGEVNKKSPLVDNIENQDDLDKLFSKMLRHSPRLARYERDKFILLNSWLSDSFRFYDLEIRTNIKFESCILHTENIDQLYVPFLKSSLMTKHKHVKTTGRLLGDLNILPDLGIVFRDIYRNNFLISHESLVDLDKHQIAIKIANTLAYFGIIISNSGILPSGAKGAEPLNKMDILKSITNFEKLVEFVSHYNTNPDNLSGDMLKKYTISKISSSNLSDNKLRNLLNDL